MWKRGSVLPQYQETLSYLTYACSCPQRHAWQLPACDSDCHLACMYAFMAWRAAKDWQHIALQVMLLRGCCHLKFYSISTRWHTLTRISWTSTDRLSGLALNTCEYENGKWIFLCGTLRWKKGAFKGVFNEDDCDESFNSDWFTFFFGEDSILAWFKGWEIQIGRIVLLQDHSFFLCFGQLCIIEMLAVGLANCLPWQRPDSCDIFLFNLFALSSNEGASNVAKRMLYATLRQNTTIA